MTTMGAAAAVAGALRLRRRAAAAVPRRRGLMQNIQFDPAEVTINAGEAVTWTNDEAVAHDVDGSGPGRGLLVRARGRDERGR